MTIPFKVSISNDPNYLSHLTNIFEELWKNGINGINALDSVKCITDILIYHIEDYIVILCPQKKTNERMMRHNKI
jgi:hypothetical protein